uniref:Uncharacterized protein n=1 Tax=Lepeophtheirus salmonis TaxID=72036 RepID=A0A0K2TG30_LEPSM
MTLRHIFEQTQPLLIFNAPISLSKSLICPRRE